MMGLGQISRLKLLMIAFYYLINAVPGSCQQTESADSHHVTLFVAVSNRENGVEITVFPDELHTELVDNRTYFIPDRSLPPECGAQYFRCQDLLVETFLPQDGREIHVLFIPLERGMAILSQLFISEDGNLIEDWYMFVVDSPDCSPTVIYKAGNGTFTVCINFTRQHIAVYEIQLYWNETQIIDRAVFEGPITQLSITNLSTFYLSNFVLNVSSQVHKVYFAVDNAIFVMDVLNATQTKKCEDLPQCQQIHKLTLADKHSLLAYCSDRYIYFDLVYGDWTQIHTYSSCGIPYLCPNDNYKVTFFNHTDLQFSVADSIQNVIYNIDINSGVCFEIDNTTYFTWSDPQHNIVFVFDFVSGNHSPISPYECSSMDCLELLFLQNQYLVVRSDNNVFVVDVTYRNEFNLIINASLELPDILTVLSIHNETDHLSTTNAFNYPTTSALFNYSTTPSPPFNYSTTPSAPFNYSTTAAPVIHNNTLIVTVTVLLLTILIVVFISIFVVLLIYRIIKKQW